MMDTLGVYLPPDERNLYAFGRISRLAFPMASLYHMWL